MININTTFVKGRDLTSDQRNIIKDMNRHFNWTPKMSQADFRMNISHYLVMNEDERLIGFIGLHYIIDEFEINTVYLDPTYRGQGIGRQLMRALFETAMVERIRRIMLEVRAQNKVAIHLYETMGFNEIARRKNYYSTPTDDAIIMEYFTKKGEEADNDTYIIG
ncbi:ribosomal protein S18-alanine N-acetyltransferase [Aerococcaceae bacterium DSM 111176]|nr:ribosomal protein S18-alanine N-acetyltransferase [Aerococcaceae bacterium DSM 111176]